MAVIFLDISAAGIGKHIQICSEMLPKEHLGRERSYFTFVKETHLFYIWGGNAFILQLRRRRIYFTFGSAFILHLGIANI